MSSSTNNASASKTGVAKRKARDTTTERTEDNSMDNMFATAEDDDGSFQGPPVELSGRQKKKFGHPDAAKKPQASTTATRPTAAAPARRSIGVSSQPSNTSSAPVKKAPSRIALDEDGNKKPDLFYKSFLNSKYKMPKEASVLEEPAAKKPRLTGRAPEAVMAVPKTQVKRFTDEEWEAEKQRKADQLKGPFNWGRNTASAPVRRDSAVSSLVLAAKPGARQTQNSAKPASEPKVTTPTKHANPRVQEHLEVANHLQAFAVVRATNLLSKQEVTTEMNSMLELKSSLKKNPKFVMGNTDCKYISSLQDYITALSELQHFLPKAPAAEKAPLKASTKSSTTSTKNTTAKATALTADLLEDISKSSVGGLNFLLNSAEIRGKELGGAIEEVEAKSKDEAEPAKRKENSAKLSALRIMANANDMLTELATEGRADKKKKIAEKKSEKE